MKKKGASAVLIAVISLIGLALIAGFASCKKGERCFNVHEYDKKFRTRYARAYPVLARDILKQANVNKGICIDIGCGPGYLGFAVAKNSTMTVHSLDISPEMIALVKKYIS